MSITASSLLFKSVVATGNSRQDLTHEIEFHGSVKQRKEKRVGWTKPNAFHVCVTSYQLAVIDSAVFKRKKWYYLILDEAHYIKNFKSQRWQALLTLNTQRRLLLSGTPLQNNLMELWSLLHFLMPHIFQSQSEFQYWFNNPMTGMVQGSQGVSSTLVGRLHGVIRPFLLRRLKICKLFLEFAQHRRFLILVTEMLLRIDV